jgi:hypothetical protein
MAILFCFRLCGFQCSVDFVDRSDGRQMAAGFDAAKGFDADAGSASEFFLIPSSFASIADDASCNACATVLDGQNISLRVRLRQRRQVGRLGKRRQPLVFRFFQYHVRFSIEMKRLRKHDSILVKPVAMSDFFDADFIALNMKLHAIIAGSQAMFSGQSAAKRFGSADVRPLSQPIEKMNDSHLDRPRQRFQLFRRLRRHRHANHDEILLRIDTIVNW